MNKKILLSAVGITVVLLLCCGRTGAQAPSTDTLHVVNWNVEYFGDPAHHTPATQVAGVRAMMRAMGADIYAICEVVNTDSFASVVNALPGGYGFEVATFGSLAPTPASSGYASAQKLAFVYRKSLVRRVATRPLMAASTAAYNEFSSGRFPMLVTAEVLGRDGSWKPLSFIVIHAKAFTDSTSCTRRIDGCHELKDTLDRYFPATAFLILGDYNDDLDTSICDAPMRSNYSYLVADSAHYKALTLPISRAGAFSIDGYTSLIDHVVSSDEMAPYYIPGSAEVLRPLAKSVDPNYDNNISDHFPVRTKYVLGAARAGTGATGGAVIALYPEPAVQALHVAQQPLRWTMYEVADLSGRLLRHGALPAAGDIDVRLFPDGMYLLRLTAADGSRAAKTFSVVH